MPRYWVTLPVVGQATIEVEADNNEHAIDVAFENITRDHLEEWECLRNGCRGNVCYLPTHSADVQEIESEDDQ